MRSPLVRVSLAVQILLIAALFIAALMGLINAILQRAVLEGSTAITIEVNESMIRDVATGIVDDGLLGDIASLEQRLASVRERNGNIESLFVSDGRIIVAASEPGRAGLPLGSASGGGDSDKGADIRTVIEKSQALSEVEKRTDIVPRLSYMHPITQDGRTVAALVAKFSLEEEFGAIQHIREALFRILVIAGVVGVPALFGILWIIIIGPLRLLKKAALKLSEGEFDIRLPAAHSAELSGLSTAIVDAAASIKSHYERYLSPQVVEVLQRQKGFLRDIRMRTSAAILVCDIEGFTSLSEGLDVDDLGLFLNGYFRSMTEILFKRNGTLDKYMGDGILAVFGAPLPMPGFRLDAVEAAIEMTAAYAAEYRSWLPAKLRQAVRTSRIRVGVASGEVFYGNVGYEKRSDFTALGMAVNLASRLQDLNKETATSILIDEETSKGLPEGDTRFKPAGAIAVRGFSEAVRVFGA